MVGDPEDVESHSDDALSIMAFETKLKMRCSKNADAAPTDHPGST